MAQGERTQQLDCSVRLRKHQLSILQPPPQHRTDGPKRLTIMGQHAPFPGTGRAQIKIKMGPLPVPKKSWIEEMKEKNVAAKSGYRDIGHW